MSRQCGRTFPRLLREPLTSTGLADPRIPTPWPMRSPARPRVAVANRDMVTVAKRRADGIVLAARTAGSKKPPDRATVRPGEVDPAGPSIPVVLKPEVVGQGPPEPQMETPDPAPAPAGLAMAFMLRVPQTRWHSVHVRVPHRLRPRANRRPKGALLRVDGSPDTCLPRSTATNYRRHSSTTHVTRSYASDPTASRPKLGPAELGGAVELDPAEPGPR